MQFLVSTSARDSGVMHPVVCVIKNVHNTKKTASVYDNIISEQMNCISEIREKVLPSNEVRAFRDLYEGIGGKVIPAGEKLLKSCIERSTFPRYTNLIDAYNIIALRTVSPFGMHDAKKLIENRVPLVFKRALGNEQIVKAFSNKVVKIKPGDFTYGIEKDGQFFPFACMGKTGDFDSAEYQLQEEKTDTILFTAIGNKETSLERNKELCHEVFKLIKMSCPEAEIEVYTPNFFDPEKRV